MQEHRIEGPDVLTPNVTAEQINEALFDDRNIAVTIHKPGSIIHTKDGREYEVQKDGMLKPLFDDSQAARFRKLFPKNAQYGARKILPTRGDDD